ncbi:helix-turn-helix domain-containing protein [Lentzea albidocapillata]|uniref:Uncharacterized protein n=1 Tax=Lentzea albidocapillata TaxID=40571 RepID=A0A1W2EQH4_9PSEU|nr:helix-turn-helix domain-containing protein [Lentzea albidocapillata]SMD11940.1 hypothetical protein SAMN05660733_04346 [Lentzea albidocapillata]
MDPSKLSDLLNGKGGVTESDVNRLVGVCRIPSEQADELVTPCRLTHRVMIAANLNVAQEKPTNA